jgi:glycosyltransferase involved in cell wall biosynthesis
MKVAFVVQRCGREVNGGAEQHCLQVASRMASQWQTEVLTTCALDYMTWDNFYPAGPEDIDGTTVRRFVVDQPRDVQSFNTLSSQLAGNQANTPIDEQERWMRAQGPISTAFLEYLEANKDSYDAFIFFGYLYATTYFGLPIVQERAYLAPLAHDEWPIYFSMWDRLFARPKGFIFNTVPEREFLRQRFPRLELSGPVVGVGIEAPDNILSGSVRSGYSNDAFLLYIGRIDESKGCKTLIEYFIRARRERNLPYKLVLMGNEVMPVPFDDDIISLGFVGETEKWEALKACDWLVMPSPHESLSMVLLEGWTAERPALVNGNCAVLRDQCIRANAGLWYQSYEEWCVALEDTTAQIKRQLGKNGKAFVRENYSWPRVEQEYLQMVDAK